MYPSQIFTVRLFSSKPFVSPPKQLTEFSCEAKEESYANFLAISISISQNPGLKKCILAVFSPVSQYCFKSDVTLTY